MAVLYLDVDDEITSAAARIRATEDERIAIVLPFGSRLATSRINFRLLAREAVQHGKSIEIVAADASARALATSAGLVVHPSVAAFEGGPDYVAPGDSGMAPPGGVAIVEPDDAPTSVILVPRESSARVPVVGRARPPVRPNVAIGVGVAVVVAIVILGLLAFTQLPSASIVLAPWSESIGPLTADVIADPSATVADPTTLTVPAQEFSFDLAASQTFPATGFKVTDTKATGTVRFANFDTGRGVLIPAGTIVRTQSGIEFATVTALTLPAASVDFFPPFATHPSTGTVGVEAVLAGPTGNVGNNSITIVSKGGKNLKVTNPDATTGGAHTEGPQVTQQDVDSAVAALTAALPDELDQQIAQASNVPSGMTIYSGTKQVGAATPSVDPTTLVGLAQPTFDLGLTATGTVLGVDAAPIRSLATERLRTRVAAGFTLDDASIIIDVGAPQVIGTTVSFPITMQAREVRTVDQAALLQAIKGLDLPAARAKLDDFGQVQLNAWPDWVTTVPTNLDRVSFTLTEPQATTGPLP